MTNTINLTPVIEAVIALCVALVTTFLIPYIKSKITKEQQDKIEYWVKIAVNAAEQTFKGTGRGEEKKKDVLQFLKGKGYIVDLDSVDRLVESAVLKLNGGGDNGDTD